MERLFKTHQIRRQDCLDGVWDFTTLSGNKSPAGRLPDAYEYRMAVPACWEMSLPYAAYRGLAAYRKTFQTKQEENLRFLFKGVSHTAEVFLDGEKLGRHYNAYTGFDFIKPKVPAGEHVLEVLVDNRFSGASKLHVPNDYYSYGGITRSVFLENVPDVFIRRAELEPFFENNVPKARIRLFLQNLSDAAKSVRLRIKGAGREETLEGEAAAGGESVLRTTLDFGARKRRIFTFSPSSWPMMAPSGMTGSNASAFGK